LSKGAREAFQFALTRVNNEKYDMEMRLHFRIHQVFVGWLIATSTNSKLSVFFWQTISLFEAGDAAVAAAAEATS
jgi:hypothetical protein